MHIVGSKSRAKHRAPCDQPNVMSKILLLFLILLDVNPALADDPPCAYFYPKLSGLPHTRLTLANDGFKSVGDGKWAPGCEIVFESNVSIVSGEKVYDTFQTVINSPGWAIDNNLSADGPGSSSATIENERSKCTILWSQHAWIDDDGEHRQSSDIRMIVQCMSK